MRSGPSGIIHPVMGSNPADASHASQTFFGRIIDSSRPETSQS
jgi:hypothetical protein